MTIWALLVTVSASAANMRSHTPVAPARAVTHAPTTVVRPITLTGGMQIANSAPTLDLTRRGFTPTAFNLGFSPAVTAAGAVVAPTLLEGDAAGTVVAAPATLPLVTEAARLTDPVVGLPRQNGPRAAAPIALGLAQRPDAIDFDGTGRRRTGSVEAVGTVLMGPGDASVRSPLFGLDAAAHDGADRRPNDVGAAPVAAPSGLHTRRPGFVGAVAWFLSPTVIPTAFDLGDKKGYYHGTSYNVLERIIDSGGDMRAPTFLSEDGGFSYSYAISKARGSGTAGVVLQFDRAPLQDRLDVDRLAINPGPGESTQGIPMFMKTREPLPLSAMTAASKEGLLRWVRGHRDANPGDPIWAERLRKLEIALGVR